MPPMKAERGQNPPTLPLKGIATDETQIHLFQKVIGLFVVETANGQIRNTIK